MDSKKEINFFKMLAIKDETTNAKKTKDSI